MAIDYIYFIKKKLKKKKKKLIYIFIIIRVHEERLYNKVFF